MSHFYRRMVPMAGLLLVQPLSGDGRAPAADLVKKEEREEEILPWLGRADLLKPVSPPSEPEMTDDPEKEKSADSPDTSSETKEVVEGEGRSPAGDENHPANDAENQLANDAENQPANDAENPEEEASGPGILPSLSAGDGPGEVSGVVSNAQGKGIANVIITLPDLGGVMIRSPFLDHFEC